MVDAVMRYNTANSGATLAAGPHHPMAQAKQVTCGVTGQLTSHDLGRIAHTIHRLSHAPSRPHTILIGLIISLTCFRLSATAGAWSR